MTTSCLRILAFTLSLLITIGTRAAEVVDMAGRKVTVPDHIERVWGSAPPLSVLLTMVAPKTMVALNMPFPPGSQPYLPSGLAGLPVLGGVYGIGREANPEEVLNAQPQIALAWKTFFVDPNMVAGFFSKINLPVVFVKLDTLADWPEAIRFTAQLVGDPEHVAAAQATYIEHAIAKVKQAVDGIAQKDRIRVYYAEGPAGLNTDCNQSFHTEAIELAGGYNIHRCAPQSHLGMEAISLEQIIAADPQVILAQDAKFAADVLKDPRWQSVRAVKDARVYAVPRLPINWIDRPPSATRALGIQWLAHLFYPQHFPLDLRREIHAFYPLFLHVDPAEAELDAVLSPH